MMKVLLLGKWAEVTAGLPNATCCSGLIRAVTPWVLVMSQAPGKVLGSSGGAGCGPCWHEADILLRGGGWSSRNLGRAASARQET